MIILSLLREITFDEFPVSGGEKAEGGGGGGCPKKKGESCTKKYKEQSLPFPGFSSPTHYCVGPRWPPAWIKVGDNRYLT